MSGKRSKPAKAKPAPAKKTAKRTGPNQPRRTAQSQDASSAAERIEQRIAGLGDWRGERLAEIRALIHEVDPEVIEDWKWMGTPVWSHEGMYVLANPHKDKVKLTFFHGAKLRDPKKLFNAGLSGNKWRAIDFREGDKLDKVALKALLRDAVVYNTQHAVPRSQGSRVYSAASARSSSAAADSVPRSRSKRRAQASK